MAVPKMNAEQLRWQAEEDASTMARYEEIMQNSKRRKAAISAAKSRATELNRRATVMNKVAGMKTIKQK